MASDRGSVVTVSGRIDPENLGITLPHEHVFIDLTEPTFELPSSAYERKLAEQPVSLENLWYIRRNPLRNRDNAQLQSIEEAIEEVGQFGMAGGTTVVDVTPKNVGGDPERVRQVSRATGIQFVHGTAYYVRSAHPDRLETASAEEITAEFVSDVNDGIGDTDVRAGLIGEIGVSGHIHEQEETVLRAGARAAARTGAPMSVHPTGRTAHKDHTYPSSRWALDILDIVEAEGLDPERVIISHMDRTPFEFAPESLEYQKRVADRGAYLEYDLWGTEISYRDAVGNGWPSDVQRMESARTLIDEGYLSKLLFSHDICLKIQRKSYGGFGYAHLLENIVPMLRERGFTREQIDTVLVDNPKRIFTFQ